MIVLHLIIFQVVYVNTLEFIKNVNSMKIYITDTDELAVRHMIV